MASVLPCFTDSKKICPVCGMYIKALEEYRYAVEIMDQLGIDAETKFSTESMYIHIELLKLEQVNTLASLK